MVSCLSVLSITLFVQHAQAAAAFDPNGSWMLGDWNGQRTALQAQGYDFSFGYTGEYAGILDSKQTSTNGSAYTGQLALGSHLDLGKILGWQDTEAQITLTYRDGQSLSEHSPALAGHQSSVQEVWGREQTWRLTDLWIKKKFLDQKLDVKVGRFGEGEDFNSFDCDFQNLALCGSQVGNWVGDQWYNWPVSQWAMRVKYNLQPDLYTQVGVYEYNPENLERGKGFNLSTDGSHGAIIPAEVVWSPKLGVQSMPGEYRLGYYYSTADAKEIADSTKTSHKQGVWVTAKQKLFQPADQTDRGLTGFVNLTFHDSDTNKVDNMQNIGLVYKGLLNQRPQDELALGVARIHINDDWSDVQAKEYDTEYNTELYYGIHATNWLTIRPNVQYVRHVGALKNGDNTWVGGIKFSTAF
ncbi:carbohydrate porin [Acinetobacter baumannii]|uniref:Carbohydrate porin n=1 Tax=Acinetobacter baumannii TaxID=470 RepID=A0A9P2L4Q8_ACIBA|nr:carbohydrate porin [Acinetobacter baumannii]EKT7958007.1 carbohydrate porin [Acinetobacter baumannii]EKT9123594.1 carbohydrate porin [Acinetobacter baumannii]EKT9271021.1 carbohydrate porin [Acinetobacter baumannii]EKT9314319.1 carbohydrate porin [Acinetobacter baumannii]EKU0108734.1 carbohydrate porin [Acinetobacter baumannii]